MSLKNAEELPRFIEPMLASAGDPPEDDAWAVEVKFDGMRAQLRFDGRKLCVRSRPGRDCTTDFPELDDIKSALAGRRVILDAELVCLDSDGKPDFEALRSRLRGTRDDRTVSLARRRAPATLMVFDVLHLDGFATRTLPYARRRELLAELALEGPSWKTPEHFVGQTAAVTRVTREQGLEGVVAKRLDARYEDGRRSRAWLKHKHRRRETMVVTGFRRRENDRDEVLLAREEPDGSLVPAGSAAFGLQVAAGDLLELLAQHERQPRRRRSAVTWVHPGVRVEVDFHGPRNRPIRDGVVRGIRLPADPPPAL